MLDLGIVTSWLLYAQEGGPGGGGGGGLFDLRGPFPLLIIIGLLFYFVLLQPERKRRRQHEELLAKLKKNDRILTLSGIYGTVVNVNKDAGDVTIKVDEATNARIRITRNSIGQIIAENEAKEK